MTESGFFRKLQWGVLALLASLLSLENTQAEGISVLPVTIRPSAGGHGSIPVRIRGAKNGVFCGQVLVPPGNRVAVSKLKGPQTIPPSAIEVLYVHPDGYSRRRKRSGYYSGLHPEPPEKTKGIQPVWIRIRVPADAKSGTYSGTVRAGGNRVGLELSVADWKLPDSQEWVVHTGLIQSPTSVAMQYGVQMWSERHWQLLEKSVKLLGEVGTKTAYLTLIRRTHFGNPHSMVYYEKLKNGTLKPDLTNAEKYIDLVVRHMGKIPVVCCYAWEMNNPGVRNYPGGTSAKDRAKYDRDILITVKNGRKLEEAVGPKWGTPECPGFWKPVFDGIRNILQKHGMTESMMVGMVGDILASPTATKDLAAAAPGIQWVFHGHGRMNSIFGTPVGVCSSVWGIYGMSDPDREIKWKWQKARYYGWKKEWRLVAYPRVGCGVTGTTLCPSSPLGMWQGLAEAAIVSRGQPKYSPGIKGFDRIGADFWPVLKGKRGSGAPICGRYPECAWGQLRINLGSPSVLAPGKDGAVTTMRFEMLRQGLQQAEARIFIERILLNPAEKAMLGKEEAARIQKILDDRVRGLLAATKNRGKNWAQWGTDFEKHCSIYGLAAQVAKKVRKGN